MLILTANNYFIMPGYGVTKERLWEGIFYIIKQVIESKNFIYILKLKKNMTQFEINLVFRFLNNNNNFLILQFSFI